MDFYLFVSTVLTLLVILDPPGILPVFLGLTRTMTDADRNRSARNASLVGFGVIAGFAVGGRQLLDYLHVSIPAIQVAGGILLLLIALELLQGKASSEVAEEGSNIAIVPLGIPLLAGPGSIVAIMLAVRHASGVFDYLAVGLALAAAMAVVYASLRFAGQIQRVLRDSGTTLASRIAGLLLAGIAVQMAADGVVGLIQASALI